MGNTQGNWKAVKVPSRNWWEIQYSEDGECVAEVVHNEADAKLMAASKELFEQLAIMTSLVRIKYGNLDKDVYAQIEKSEAILNKVSGSA